jgi:hypothetical protein
VKSRGTRRKGAFAGCAPPELDDLELLLADAAAGEVAAVAVGQDSGCLLVSGTRAIRGMGGDILLIVCGQRTMRCTDIE